MTAPTPVLWPSEDFAPEAEPEADPLALLPLTELNTDDADDKADEAEENTDAAEERADEPEFAEA
jgi:hypothetical protein